MNPYSSDILSNGCTVRKSHRWTPTRGTVKPGGLGVLALAAFLLLLVGCGNPEGASENASVDGETAESQNQEPAVAEPPGMNFYHGSFEDALALAEAGDKKVFVDVYTTWCGPCIVMQETVFPLPEVGEYFNARFVNFKLDAENEDQNGPEIAARYDIGVYPTYLILESDGTELSRATHAMSGSQFIELASRMLGESESTFEQSLARYESGDRDQEFVQQLLLDVIVETGLEYMPKELEAMRAQYERHAQFKLIADEYFESRDYSELVNETDARLVLYYRDKTMRGDELVEYVFENFEQFLEVSTDAAMSQFVLNSTWYAALEAAQSGDETYVRFIEEIEAEPLSRAGDYERQRDPESRLVPEQLRETLEFIYLESREDWDALLAKHQQRIEESDVESRARRYSSAARSMSRSDNPEHVDLATQYAKRAFDMDQVDPLIAVDYVSILIGRDEMEKARKVGAQYRSGLSDSSADQDRLEIFNRIVGAVLAADVEEVVEGT